MLSHRVHYGRLHRNGRSPNAIGRGIGDATEERRKCGRTGPPRDLTRTRIIEAALVLIDRKGPEAVTMRAVADALGVTAMALYNHFGCKDDLLRAMAAQGILRSGAFDIEERATGGPRWKRVFASSARSASDTPASPACLKQRSWRRKPCSRRWRSHSGRWGKPALATSDGLRAYFTLVGFTLAQTSYQSRGPVAGLEPSDRIAGHGYEAAEGLEMPETWDFKAAFEYGLRLILDGVECAAARA